jgi:hypothetical protein
MSEADTSQRIEEKKLELVEALGALISPMDEILQEHKASQKRGERIAMKLDEVATRLRVVSRLMFFGCFIGALLLIGLAYALYIQADLRSVQRDVLAETLEQKKSLSRQETKTDDLKTKLDEQPTIKLKPAVSGDPSAQPSFVLDAPVSLPSAKGVEKAQSQSKPPAPRVEVPIEFPSPKKK